MKTVVRELEHDRRFTKEQLRKGSDNNSRSSSALQVRSPRVNSQVMIQGSQDGETNPSTFSIPNHDGNESK